MWMCFVRERVLVSLWFFFNIMDMLLTLAVVGAGASELLPVARTLLEWGPLSFIFFKTMTPLILLPLLYWFGHFQLLRILDIFLGIVVIWNMFVFVLIF